MVKNEYHFKNRTALITGGAQGFGLDIAKRFLNSGAKVIIWDIDAKLLDIAKKDIKNENLSSDIVDVSNYEEVKIATSKILKNSNIDVLINNAGTNLPEPFLKVKQSSLNTLLNINTKSAFNMAKLCVDKMLEHKNRKKIGGAVVHISSMFGLVGGPNRTVYSMTKFGLEGLTRGMAVDLAKFNIRTNSVCPTFVETPRAKKYLANKNFKKYAISNIPLGKIATESDVATSVTFLSSSAASMITGTNIIIDGGWTAK